MHKGRPQEVVDKHVAQGWTVDRRTRWTVYLSHAALPGTYRQVSL